MRKRQLPDSARSTQHSALAVRETVETQERLTTRTIALRAATVNEQERSVEAVLTTENPVQVVDWERWEVVDEILLMSGMSMPANRQVPLLDTHSRYSVATVLGSTRDIRVEGSTLVGRRYFSRKALAVETFQDVRDGHITDGSIGYRVERAAYVDPEQTVEIEGRSFTAGKRTLKVALNWRLKEDSVCPIGADEMAKFRETPPAGAAIHKERVMGFEKWLQRRGIDPRSLNDARRAELLEEYRREIGTDARTGDEPAPPAGDDQRAEDPAPPPNHRRDAGATPPAREVEPAGTSSRTPDAAAIAAETLRAERQRVRSIEELAGDDIDRELVQRAIHEGWDDARASREFLAAMRTRSAPVNHAPGIIARDHERDCTLRALAAGLRIRAGLTRPTSDMNEQQRTQLNQDLERGHRYHDMSLIDVVREAVRLDGGRLPHNRFDQIRAAVSGGSLTAIFTTSAYARLLTSWDEAGDSTEGWVSETDNANYLQQERVTFGKTAGLKKLARGKTADHAAFDDKVEYIKVARFAEQFVVDEQDIIDDNLNALRQAPAELGMAARRLRPDLVYALLLENPTLNADGVAVFHAASHGNLGTTSTALAAATLQAGIIAMASQTMAKGKEVVQLNIEPRFLIVPQDLRFTATILLNSAQRIISTSDGGTLNPLNELGIQLRVDNRLGAGGVQDPDSGVVRTGTATNWFLAASPAGNRTVEVAYLSGTGRRPMMRSFALDKGQWGIGFDVKMDIGANILDYRGLYKATGAS